MKDSDLLELIDKVALSYLVKRFGGWDASADWFVAGFVE